MDGGPRKYGLNNKIYNLIKVLEEYCSIKK